MKKEVFVGMSGGVDSSVAAYLLQNEGYNVTGVYMKNWSGDGYGLEDHCPWEEDLEFVRSVSEKLGIELKIYNFEREYREAVIDDFFEQYGNGNTPNPDILCNKFIKFEAFLRKALVDGADLIATGHYARTSDGRLYRPFDLNKDQTYFLSALNKAQLQSTLFPLGELRKDEVREIAREQGLLSAERPDSQGICFIGEVDIKEFLSMNLKSKTGEIIDIDTKKVVGTHDGVWFYTIGQRKGLKVGGAKMPYYVVGKQVNTNRLLVGMGREHPLLWQKTLRVNELQMINDNSSLPDDDKLVATIRYRGKCSKVEILSDQSDNNAHILTFEEPQWAPAPGQSVVFYRDNECLGLATTI